MRQYGAVRASEGGRAALFVSLPATCSGLGGLDVVPTQVIPLYCFDPRNYLTTPAGNNKTGSTRAKFVRESVHELKKSLKAIGSDLAVALDRPENVIPGVAECLCCIATLCVTRGVL